MKPLTEWLDTLPEPETIREKAVCWWSDLVDEMLMLKAKIRVKSHNIFRIFAKKMQELGK